MTPRAEKAHILLMGQTPPPWHGQAVATQILFEHNWPDFHIHRLRMEFSEEMHEVGRLQVKKIGHLYDLVMRARRILRENPGTVLLYPPASAKWVPFLRDIIFLACVRPLAGRTVFIFHASGLPVFSQRGLLRRLLARIAYYRADFSLEVANEKVTPHHAFQARSWEWCPCAIAVPEIKRSPRQPGAPLEMLFVGSLQEGKGVLEILRTAECLKQRGVGDHFRFRIVGKWFSEEFEREARAAHLAMGLGNMVDFAGQLTGDDKWRAYEEADVFFFPTHYASEATPIVLMEALGAGLPLLTTRWAGIPAMLEGCESARLCDIRSPEQYAAELENLQQDTVFRNRCEDLSREHYRHHFRPESFIGRVANAFHHVTQSGLETEATMASRSASEMAPRVSVYLADQNPGYDRSFGISRMSRSVLEALISKGGTRIEAIVSKTSQQAPDGTTETLMLPWGTRKRWVRLLTDHLHPVCIRLQPEPDLYYFPKGYLPLLSVYCQPSVVTIHDTIIQYYEDHYPAWRTSGEYAYWAGILKHTLRNATCILTVSQSSKDQIVAFMKRHKLPEKEITVTYEPCAYEFIPQPEAPEKKDYVIHLASSEPHKRTEHLIHWWLAAEKRKKALPKLHLIGTVPKHLLQRISESATIVKRPFLADEELQAAYSEAQALILPSEVEGFGLPALEAYYMGTPVCFVSDTSVEEILAPATSKGGFNLNDADSFFSSLQEVMEMEAGEIRRCGLLLRETYAVEKVLNQMVSVFQELTKKSRDIPFSAPLNKELPTSVSGL